MTRRAVYPFIEKTGYPAKYSAKPYNRGQKPRKTHVCSCLDLFIAEIKIWVSVKYVSRRWGKWPDVRHSATPDIQFLISRISGIGYRYSLFGASLLQSTRKLWFGKENLTVYTIFLSGPSRHGQLLPRPEFLQMKLSPSCSSPKRLVHTQPRDS